MIHVAQLMVQTEAGEGQPEAGQPKQGSVIFLQPAPNMWRHIMLELNLA